MGSSRTLELCADPGLAVGFAFFYFRFSSFRGRPYVWLDDLYVHQVAKRLDRTIASVSKDMTIRVWDARTYEQRYVLKGIKAAYSSDGVLVSYANGVVHRWESQTGVSKGKMKVGPCSCLAVLPPRENIVIGAEKTISIWNIDKRRRRRMDSGHEADVTCVAVSPNGRMIASCALDRTARVWDAETGVQLMAFHSQMNMMTSVAFAPNGRTLAVGAWDRNVHLIDLVIGDESATLVGHDGWVSSVAFSPDGSRIVTGSMDHTVRIWDMELTPPVQALPGHIHDVWMVAFSPDGNTVASGGADEAVCLWDANTGRLLEVMKDRRLGEVGQCYLSVQERGAEIAISTRSNKPPFGWYPAHKPKVSSSSDGRKVALADGCHVCLLNVESFRQDKLAGRGSPSPARTKPAGRKKAARTGKANTRSRKDKK